MFNSKLKPNDNKTEPLQSLSNRDSSNPITNIVIGSNNIPNTDEAENLSVIFDSNLSLSHSTHHIYLQGS